MEQSLADLTMRGVITLDVALSRSSRPEQLVGLLERAGFAVPAGAGAVEPAASLRVAEG